MKKIHKIFLFVALLLVAVVVVAIIVGGQIAGEQNNDQDVVSMTHMISFKIFAVMHYESNDNSYEGVCESQAYRDLGAHFSTTECESTVDYYRILGELTGGNFACLYRDEKLDFQEDDFYVIDDKSVEYACGEKAPTFGDYLKLLRE